MPGETDHLPTTYICISWQGEVPPGPKVRAGPDSNSPSQGSQPPLLPKAATWNVGHAKTRPAKKRGFQGEKDSSRVPERPGGGEVQALCSRCGRDPGGSKNSLLLPEALIETVHCPPPQSAGCSHGSCDRTLPRFCHLAVLVLVFYKQCAHSLVLFLRLVSQGGPGPSARTGAYQPFLGCPLRTRLCSRHLIGIWTPLLTNQALREAVPLTHF